MSDNRELNQKVTNANRETVGTVRKPGYISNGNQNYLILDAPTEDNMKSYIEVLRKKKVSIVVCACTCNYDPKPIIEADIRHKKLPFSDGEPPPQRVIEEWLLLLSEEFNKRKVSKANKVTIGVHCLAGLGRAPILVAIALVESGKEGVDAIDIIRSVRKGAFNAKQVDWISKYKPQKKMCAPMCAIC